MMLDDYIPDERILEACPKCGSGRLACVVGQDFDFCMECHRIWERLAPNEAYTIDGEQMAFHIPCDNCAFRGDSLERQDAQGWAELQAMLAGGGEFYCHKGVPLKVDVSALRASRDIDMGFDFPRKTETVDIGGQCHPYLHYDKERMRLCRGYLNAHVGPLLKKAFPHAQE
jgi:hypothetical protein